MENKYISKIAMSKILKFLRTIKSIYAINLKKIKRFILATLWIIRIVLEVDSQITKLCFF